MAQIERPLGRNDPCHCGSGRKYKHCHLSSDFASGGRPIYCASPIERLKDLQSLRQNTLDFIECLRGDLGIEYDHQTGEGLICRDMSDGAVKRTFGRLPYFFPHKANYASVCREIADSHTSGMYWGGRDVNSVANHIARYALYTPHIVIANPFCDRMLYHLDCSPVEHPSIWKQVVANRAMFLVSIEPWIRGGVISLLPALKWTDWEYYDREIDPLANNRLDSFTSKQRNVLMYQTFMDWATTLHPRYLPLFLKKYMADAPPVIIEDFKRRVTKEYETNPLRYAWSGEGIDQITASGPGNNLEAAVFQADLCRSYLLFGEHEYRREYDFSLEQNKESIPKDALTQVSKAFAALDFSFLNNVKLDFVLDLRKDNRLTSLRDFLHSTWNRVSSIDGIERLSSDVAFREALEDEYARYKVEWKAIQTRLLRDVVISTAAATASVLSGQFQFSVAFGGLAAFKLKTLMDAYSKRKDTERLPLGIFLHLERS